MRGRGGEKPGREKREGDSEISSITLLYSFSPSSPPFSPPLLSLPFLTLPLTVPSIFSFFFSSPQPFHSAGFNISLPLLSTPFHPPFLFPFLSFPFLSFHHFFSPHKPSIPSLCYFFHSSLSIHSLLYFFLSLRPSSLPLHTPFITSFISSSLRRLSFPFTHHSPSSLLHTSLLPSLPLLSIFPFLLSSLRTLPFFSPPYPSECLTSFPVYFPLSVFLHSSLPFLIFPSPQKTLSPPTSYLLHLIPEDRMERRS